VEYLEDREHLRLSEGREQRMLISQFLSVHEEQVSGIVKALPIVGMWEDQDGRLLHVAIGRIE